MSTRVLKYPFAIADVVELTLPKGAKILHIDVQRGGFCCWARVDEQPAQSTAIYRIRCAGTGHTLDEHVGDHINSILVENGSFVFHFFEYWP